MKTHWLWLSLGFGVLFLLLSVGATAYGQAPLTPDTLVLRFDESAAALDQPSIRAAIAQELSMTLATEGSDQAATLVVAVSSGGEVQLSYRPSREVLTRSVPITNTSDVPRLLAHLAGNLVRNEAGALIADLQTPPAAAAPPPAPPAPAPVLTVDSDVSSAPSSDASANDGNADAAAPVPYLHDAWIFSVMGGIQVGQREVTPAGPSYLQLALQQSKRVGDFEVAISARVAYGALDVLSVTYDPTGEVFDDMTIGVQVTVPVSVEYRVLQDKHGYLQLGGSVGVQVVGVANGRDNVTSGSDFYATLGVQATAGFRLAGQHGLVLRVGWDFFPTTQTVPSGEYTHRLSPLQPGFNLGWQIGW